MFWGKLKECTYDRTSVILPINLLLLKTLRKLFHLEKRWCWIGASSLRPLTRKMFFFQIFRYFFFICKIKFQWRWLYIPAGITESKKEKDFAAFDIFFQLTFAFLDRETGLDYGRVSKTVHDLLSDVVNQPLYKTAHLKQWLFVWQSSVKTFEDYNFLQKLHFKM